MLATVLPAVGAIGLDALTREQLVDRGSRPVWLALPSGAQGPSAAGRLLGFGTSDLMAYDFPLIGATVGQAFARDVLTHADSPALAGLEVLEDALAPQVQLVLHRLNQILRYAQIGAVSYGAVNLSIGVPSASADRPGSGDAIVRAAIEKVVLAGIPVVIAAGNDGPSLGIMNPWARVQGCIVAAAADAHGTSIARDSARLTVEQRAGRLFVAADGVARTGGPSGWLPSAKCPLVPGIARMEPSAGSLVHGTSQAAGAVSRMLSIPHQAMALLRAKLSLQASLRWTNSPFVTGYIELLDPARHDVGHLAEHVAREMRRHAGRRLQASGPIFEIDANDKRRLVEKLLSATVDMPVAYGPAIVARILTAAARPVPGYDESAVGVGFVNPEAVMRTVAGLRIADLPRLLLSSGHPRRTEWIQRWTPHTDPLFTDAELASIWTYSSCFTLQDVLPLDGQN